jgi:small subunit ribosomal protein S4
MRLQRKSKTMSRRGAKSEYGKQMLEKQKARFSYGIGGKQFTNYVKKALKSTGDNGKNLLSLLESRLDNTMVRAGYAPSHSAARQMVSHGHIAVNGVNVRVPSHQVRLGDTLTIREGSKSKVIFSKLDEQLKTIKHPNWMSIDEKTKIEPSASTTLLLLVSQLSRICSAVSSLDFFLRKSKNIAPVSTPTSDFTITLRISLPAT